MKNRSLTYIITAVVLCMLFALAGCGGRNAPAGDDKGGGDTEQAFGTVVFDSRGGSAVNGLRVPYGSLIDRPQAPVYDGFVLLGWFKNAQATEEWNFDTDRVRGDLTLYAGWRAVTGSAENPGDEKDPDGEKDPDNGKKILVAYFSATGTTARAANAVVASVDADAYGIVPAVPYTSADLNYNDPDSRTSKENRDDGCRPEIAGSVQNFERYDVIFIGYPIWHGKAPKIIYTFLESYDFSGKTVIPFCTSASSGIGTSATNLHGLAPSAIWKTGARISGNDVSALIRQMDGQ